MDRSGSQRRGTDRRAELCRGFLQAFIESDRWLQYLEGVGTTLVVTAMALVVGVILGSVVAFIRVTHDQQRAGHKNPVLGLVNLICEIYSTVIRGTPMMVQLYIMGLVVFSSSREFTLVGALSLGINSAPTCPRSSAAA